VGGSLTSFGDNRQLFQRRGWGPTQAWNHKKQGEARSKKNELEGLKNDPDLLAWFSVSLPLARIKSRRTKTATWGNPTWVNRCSEKTGGTSGWQKHQGWASQLKKIGGGAPIEKVLCKERRSEKRAGESCRL